MLVVEDEFLLADLLQRTLEQSGAEVVGPIGNLPDAMRQAAKDGFEVAVVDLNLREEMAYPLARVLRQQEVPFVFATSYSQSAIPSEFASVKRWEKPYDEDLLVADLARICSAASS